MLAILSNAEFVRILFIIGIAFTALPIFFYILKNRKKAAKYEETPLSRAVPYVLVAGIVMLIPMLCLWFMYIFYDADSFTDNDILYLAARNGNSNVAQRMLERGAEPDGDTRYGMTAAYCAVNEGRYEVEKLMLQAGSDPNYCGSQTVTPIAAAARNQDNEMAKLLIAAGADPDYMSDVYVPALHMAGAYDRDYNDELVNVLIAGGADAASAGLYDGKVTYPYRYYFDKYIADCNAGRLTPSQEMRYEQISLRLKTAYVERLEKYVDEHFGLDMEE